MKEDAFKKIESMLYKPESEALAVLTPTENERRKRWVFCIARKMEDPLISDKYLVSLLESGMPSIFEAVHKSTAYRDLAYVTRIIGNIGLAAKNWYRYMIIEGSKKAYELAESKGDAKGMATALDKIGKYTMADKPDNDVDWSAMIPINIEPSADADLLENVEKIDNVDKRRQELRNLFKTQLQNDATDIIEE